jgi:dTDP-4-dehydrorhamnose 3,5-epimerase
MKLSRANIPDLVICEPKKLKDERGFFCESFRKDSLENLLGYSLNFCQENFSESKYGVLRGLHYQKGIHSQAKLVRVTQGEVLDVAVDVRENSETILQHITVKLSSENKKQLFVPRGFAHGFIVLSDTVQFNYKCDNFYNKASESGIIYNDETLNIDWVLDKEEFIISEKDTILSTVKELF